MPNLGRFRDLVTTVAAAAAAAVRRPRVQAAPYTPRHSREHGAGATVPLGPVRARATVQVPPQRFVVAGANSGRHSAP